MFICSLLHAVIFKPISHVCNLPFIALLLQNIQAHTAKDIQISLCRKKTNYLGVWVK